jgi:hypothetical protein
MGLLAMAFGIGRAAKAAQFLRPGIEHADRAQGLALRLNPQGGCRHDRAADPIVDGPGALVPAVEVAGHQHHRQARVTARQIGHDIARGRTIDRLPGEREVQRQRAAPATSRAI